MNVCIFFHFTKFHTDHLIYEIVLTDHFNYYTI